jgi:hypothetical protein
MIMSYHMQPLLHRTMSHQRIFRLGIFNWRRYTRRRATSVLLQTENPSDLLSVPISTYSSPPIHLLHVLIFPPMAYHLGHPLGWLQTWIDNASAPCDQKVIDECLKALLLVGSHVLQAYICSTGELIVKKVCTY